MPRFVGMVEDAGGEGEEEVTSSKCFYTYGFGEYGAIGYMFINIKLNTHDLKSQNWERFLDDLTDRTSFSYSEAFGKAAIEAAEKGDERSKEILSIFQGMTSMMLSNSDKDHPFSPSILWKDGSRSAIILDFSNEQIEAFKEWLDVCVDPELKSRIADIIWTRKRQGNHLIAEIAIKAYLDSADILFKGEYPHLGVERITRALHLSVNLGRNSNLFSKVTEKIFQLVEEFAKENSNTTLKLIQLLAEYYKGDTSKLIEITESLAKHHITQKNWYVAIDSLELESKLHRKTKNREKELLALEKISQLYLQEADDLVNSGQGYMVAAHSVQSAIEALRKIPNTGEKQKELHKIFLDYQEKSLQEFAQVSGEVDLTKPVEIVINQVVGKTLFDAIFALSMLVSPKKKSELEAYVEELTQRAPPTSILSTVYVDSRGRVVAQKPSLLSDDPEVVAQAKLAEMHFWMSQEQEAGGMILHIVRLRFLNEHNPTFEDLLRLVLHNPFVPPGTETIYAKGLLHGLQGDYLTALHLLIPQVENSIRYVLNNREIITSGLNSDGIQEEYDLGKLLDMPELSLIFGDDLVFQLKGIFVERFGWNYRNLFAHGLLNENDFLSSRGVYVWCVILRLCCLPIVIKQREQKTDPPIP